MEKTRQTKLPSWLKDYALPSSDEDRESSPPRKKRITLGIEVPTKQNSHIFATRFHLPSVLKSIRYTPLTFVSEINKRKLACARNAYLQAYDFSEEAAQQFYSNAQQFVQAIREAGNDDRYAQNVIICPLRDGKLGLRARKTFSKGEIIGLVGGEVVPLARRIDTTYLMRTSFPEWAVDWEKHRSYAAMITDSPFGNAVAGIYNGEKVPQIVVVAICKIKKGTDICYLVPT